MCTFVYMIRLNAFLYPYFPISNKRSFDTANIDLKFKNNTTASIFLTYASPHSQSIKLYFTNSIVEYNNKTLMLFYPRDVFNSKGLYKSPKKKILCKTPCDV